MLARTVHQMVAGSVRRTWLVVVVSVVVCAVCAAHAVAALGQKDEQ